MRLCSTIKISQEEKDEYKKFILEQASIRLFVIHVIDIIKKYAKFSSNEKKRAYIYIYYNAADYPILTIDCY